MKRYLVAQHELTKAGEAKDIVARANEIVVCCQGIAPHWIRRDEYMWRLSGYADSYTSTERIESAVFSALITGNAVVTDEAE